mgnify:CR=1 FL=1
MASVVGKIRKDGQYIVHNKGEQIVAAKAKEVTKGFIYDRPYKKRKSDSQEPQIDPSINLNEIFYDRIERWTRIKRES